MPAVERQRRFTELLSRRHALDRREPGTRIHADADQYRCYIGVGNAREWEQFREEIFSAAPTQAGITRQQISFVDAGIQGPGGMLLRSCPASPLAVLRGLDTWRTSYRKESSEYPYTPIRTRRNSPIRWCRQRTSSAGSPRTSRLFCSAVMMRVLVRDPSARVIPPGQYQFTIGRGDVLGWATSARSGSTACLTTSASRSARPCKDRLDTLDKTQVGALAALAHVVRYGVYSRASWRTRRALRWPARDLPPQSRTSSRLI